MKRSKAQFKARVRPTSDPRTPRDCPSCRAVTARRPDGLCRQCLGDPPVVPYQPQARPQIADVTTGLVSAPEKPFSPAERSGRLTPSNPLDRKNP